MSNLSVFNFEEGKEVRTMTDERDGSVWFVLKDVLAAMGTTTRPAIAKDSIEGVFGTGYMSNTKLDTGFGIKDTTIINETAVTFLVSRSTTESGKKLNRWIHAEVIPSIRKSGSYSVPNKSEPRSLEDTLKAAGIIADILNLNGSSRVGALRRTVAKLDTNLLPMIPDYSVDAPVVSGGVANSSEVCYSMTELLKRHDAPFGAVTANKRLVEAGLLEEKQRPSSKGTKSFKCVAKKGLKYGKNVVSDQNPRETQPQWFESAFPELLGVIS